MWAPTGLHRQGGWVVGRVVRRAAGLAFAAILAAGCASSVPYQPTSSRQPQPIPLDDQARYVAGLRLPELTPNGPDGRPVAALPSLRPVTDGPVASVLRPSNDRQWTPDQERLPTAEFQGQMVRVRNVRNAEYRTVEDYTVRYEDRTYDLRKLTSVDFIVVPFSDMPAIAHVMLSFGFEDKDYLVLSVEIRKQQGEKYDAVKGFFNQYELMYVMADERDVLWRQGTGFLCEVFLYRTRATPDQARTLLLDVLRRMNQLSQQPEFYNTLTNNCTTNIRDHINRLKSDRVPYNYRVLLPGYSDRLAYDLGLLDTQLSFEQARERARVNYQAYLYRDDPEFSQKIREGGAKGFHP